MFLLNLDIKSLNRFFLYLFAFSIAFERAFPFLPGMSYPKFVAILYVGSLLCNPYYISSLQEIKVPNFIFLLFALFLANTFFNSGIFEFGIRLDLSFLLNTILVLFLLNHEKIDPGILSRCFIFFLLGYMVLVAAYYLGYYQVGIGGRVRIGAALPNSLAFFGVFAICANFLFSNTYKTSIYFNTLQVISSLLIISLILATGSRSALIALVLVFGVYFLCTSKNRLGFLILAVLTVPIFYAGAGVITERVVNSATTGDLGGRLAIILFCIDVISSNPIFGVGAIQYDILAERTFGNSPSPHNVFLQTYLYGGIVALSIWTFILLKLFRIAYKLYRRSGNFTCLMLLPPIFLMGVSGQVFNNSLVFLVFAVIISNQRFLKHA